MGRLAAGDDQSSIPFEGRNDEIGSMAAAVEVFRQNSLTNKRLEAEALANRSEAEKAREAEQRRLAIEAEQLRTATTSLGENLKRLASGDLKCRIDTEFAAAYEGLRTDFNATVDQLSQDGKCCHHGSRQHGCRNNARLLRARLIFPNGLNSRRQHLRRLPQPLMRSQSMFAVPRS